MLTLLLHLVLSLGLFFHYTYVKPPNLIERQKTEKKNDFLTPNAVLNRAIAKGDGSGTSALRNRYGRLTALGSFGMQQWGGPASELPALQGAAPAAVEYNQLDSAGPFGDPSYNKDSFAPLPRLAEVSELSSGDSAAARGSPAYADYLETNRFSHQKFPASSKDVGRGGADGPWGHPAAETAARAERAGERSRNLDQARQHPEGRLAAAAGAAVGGKDAGMSNSMRVPSHEDEEVLSCGQKTYRVLVQAPWRWIKGRRAWLQEAVLEDETFRQGGGAQGPPSPGEDGLIREHACLILCKAYQSGEVVKIKSMRTHKA